MLQIDSIKNNDNVRAALYARVSSVQQAAAGTIQSQVDAIVRRGGEDGVEIEPESRFIDEGHSGATLVRPALERLRDAAAAGAIDRLYVLCPDRLSRRYAHQMVLVDELRRCGVEVVFINQPLGQTPEDHLLLQVQGMIAEYERAKIMERSRRGKLHAARQGKVNVLTGAPFGYRYVPAAAGVSDARYDVYLPDASVVQRIFHWVGLERKSLRQVCRELEKQGVCSPSGMKRWNAGSVKQMLVNPAYKGTAAYGKTRRGSMRPRLRPVRGSSGIPRGGQSIYDNEPQQWISIAVPAIVSEALFQLAAGQLEQNRQSLRQRHTGPRHLLQGLVVCKTCGYACCGTHSGCRDTRGGTGKTIYGYYRCQGSQPSRCGGERLCTNKSVRQELLDEAVWNDVRQLLADPARVQHELQRRMEADQADPQQQNHQKLQSQATRIRRGITRLIDAYEQGLVEKIEFEPRIKSARQQLSLLQEQLHRQADQQAEAREMKLVIDNLQDFSQRVACGLEQADWQTRRQIITTLVKRIELEPQQVRIVYRVDLSPFDRRPERGVLEHCKGRQMA